jgi:RIO kinase 1
LIELGQILVQGGWCQIIAVQGQTDICAKVLIPKRRFKGTRPDPDLIVKKKYGIEDFLEYEWNNYQKIMAACPDDLKAYFVHMHGIEMTKDGRKALVMNTILNDEGAIASNLVNNTVPLGPKFRQILERIRNEVFIAHNIDHFGIARRNILVHNPDHPVIIDFQTGRERFRGQFWLRHPWFVKQKINRCFRKLYQEIEKS